MAIVEPSDPYQRSIRELSDRLVEAQRPIRILDAIKWDGSIQQAFFDGGCRENPPVDQTYYQNRPLSFEPLKIREEFSQIERDIVRKLGQFNPVGQIMRRMCREYQLVVRMLEARGTTEFSTLSQELYGSANDAFHAGDPTLADLGELLDDTLKNIDRYLLEPHEPKTLTGEEVVTMLQQRLQDTFRDAEHKVSVLLSDGIIADASAGSNYLKIRKEARFSERDVRALEVHEGWVHLGTTLNGMCQPVCTFLSKGPPSATITQEGLAIIMEIFSFASHPTRVRKISNRIRAVHMAEEGATFLDVFRFFVGEGTDPVDAYQCATRVFRGSTPVNGPFTKDITYAKGFILIYNYIRLAVRKGKLSHLPLLFCGKTTLEDMRTLVQLVDEKIVAPPRFLPPPFADLSALTAWMCFSNFLNRLNLQRIEADYANIF